MDRSQANSLHGSRNNIHRHYDLGNDFYKLWLDRQTGLHVRIFSSAFGDSRRSAGSQAGLHCRKLQLQPGERVVEAGCGWGALALHMARTLWSVRQGVQYLPTADSPRASARLGGGLDDKVEFVEDDCRNISGKFDVFVSVGMLEHLSVDDYAHLGEVIHRCIGDSGRGLLHFIGRSYKGAFSRWIRKADLPWCLRSNPRRGNECCSATPLRSVGCGKIFVFTMPRTLEHWLETI